MARVLSKCLEFFKVFSENFALVKLLLKNYNNDGDWPIDHRHIERYRNRNFQ